MAIQSPLAVAASAYRTSFDDVAFGSAIAVPEAIAQRGLTANRPWILSPQTTLFRSLRRRALLIGFDLPHFTVDHAK
jgi:hypothetical protein